MLMLTLEERGAYNTLLDLIYDRAGPIPDDARWLAGWMGCSVRRWAVIRASLIVKGKIFEADFHGVASLMNERAAIEIENQTKRQRKLSESGAKGGRKRTETDKEDNKNNAEVQASAKASPKLKTETRTETETSITPDGVIVPLRAPKPNGFARFWEAYPNKIGKRDAEKAYAKALKLITGPDPPGVIFDGLARAKASRQWLAGYIPHPKTWLNRGSWDDQPAEPPSRQPDVRPDNDPRRSAREENYSRAIAGFEIAARGRGER